jgi:hypothetical protein
MFFFGYFSVQFEAVKHICTLVCVLIPKSSYLTELEHCD